MRKLLEKLRERQKLMGYLMNTGWLVFDKIFHMALSLIVTGMMSRYLSVGDYGMLNYGLAYIEIFTIVCKLGIDGIIVNEIVRQRDKVGEILGSTTVLRLVSSLLSLGITAIFVKVLNPGNGVVLVITVIQSVSLLFVAFDTIDFYFQSCLKSKYTAIARSVSYPLVCLLRLLFIFLKMDVEWFAWATVLDALTIAVLLFYFYRRMGCPKLKFSLKMVKHLLSHSYHFIFVNLLVTIYTQMDKLMVGAFSTQEEVGFYSAGMLIANLWIFIPNALIDSGRPLIMTLKAEKKETDYIMRSRQLSAGIIWISIAAGIFFTIFGKWVMLLVYGEAYLAAVPVLMYLIWSRLFSLIGALRSIWMLCEGYEKDIKYFIALGAVMNVVLNACLIPRIGAQGAAVATLITEIVSSFIATACYKKTRPLFKLYVEALLVKKCLGNK